MKINMKILTRRLKPRVRVRVRVGVGVRVRG
jgi:hypothetical protein